MPINLITSPFLENDFASDAPSYIVYGANPVLGAAPGSATTIFTKFSPNDQVFDGKPLTDYQEDLSRLDGKALPVGTVILAALKDANVKILHAVVPCLNPQDFCYALTKPDLQEQGVLKVEKPFWFFSGSKTSINYNCLTTLMATLYFNIFEQIRLANIKFNGKVQIVMEFFGEKYGIDDTISAIALTNVIRHFGHRCFEINIHGVSKRIFDSIIVNSPQEYQFNLKELGVNEKRFNENILTTEDDSKGESSSTHNSAHF